MNKKIFYQQENNLVGMLTPAPDSTIEEILVNIPSGARHVTLDEVDFPKDEDLFDFFEALTIDFNSNKVSFNILAAREITKNRLRKERTKFFEKNDLALRDAMLENNLDKINAAITERDRLRNITNLTEFANNLHELRTLSVE